MSPPSLDSRLPDFFPFVRDLIRDHESGALNSWDGAAERVHTYFTPQRLAAFESVIPSWTEMASYANGQTLIHVSLVFIALLMLPEYKALPPYQQHLAEWIAAFHDVSKQPRRGSHDWTHGFRSAALAGRTLPQLGFPLREPDPTLLTTWTELTTTAMTPHPSEDTLMQDNRQLPAIVDGINTLFGVGAPAATIIKGVLFHMSIDIGNDYPTAVPLSDEEILHYIDSETLPLLQVMMLVDCDGWALFEPHVKARDRQCVLNVYRRLGFSTG